MTIDLERARAETPGTAHVAHFNNAGAALPPQAVLDAAIGHLRLATRRRRGRRTPSTAATTPSPGC